MSISLSLTKYAEQSKLVNNHLWGLNTKLSASSTPFIIQRYSGKSSAEPAKAASTCSHIPYFEQMAAISGRGSTDVGPVVPTAATTHTGFNPAAISLDMASSSRSGLILN